jgi:hypothetical protein
MLTGKAKNHSSNAWIPLSSSIVYPGIKNDGHDGYHSASDEV